MRVERAQTYAFDHVPAQAHNAASMHLVHGAANLTRVSPSFFYTCSMIHSTRVHAQHAVSPIDVVSVRGHHTPQSSNAAQMLYGAPQVFADTAQSWYPPLQVVLDAAPEASHVRGPLPCPEPGCDSTFTCTASKNRHIRSCHYGVQYACEHCGSTCNRADNLLVSYGML